MFDELKPFYPGQQILMWVVAVVVLSIMAFFVGLLISFSAYGLSGPKLAVRSVFRGFADLFTISAKRVLSIAILTFKEAQRRKAFNIGFLFILLFMFGGWFLGDTDLEKPAKPYVSFVMWATNMLLLLMAVLVSCWGLPADIKARSLHTVVTKPVRRSEIVLGRMFGYSAVLTLVLVVTAVLGYFWIWRQVPDRAQDQLTARVPIFAPRGNLDFTDRNGNEAQSGVNVGDVWEYRSFVEGQTKARAIWKFENVDVAALRKQGFLRLEQNFEAFRTFKGEVDEEVRYSVTLVNPTKELRVPVGNFPVNEFASEVDAGVVVIDETLNYYDSYSLDAKELEANLFDDCFDGNDITVEIACVDQQQYLGVALQDMFIRMPDRTFLETYAKSMFTSWLMVLLVVFIGTTASCFLKGPVSTMLTASMIILGQGLRKSMDEMLQQLNTSGEVLGGGTFESVYRLVTQMDQQSPLPDNVGRDVIEFMDDRVFDLLRVASAVIPNLSYYDTDWFVAEGFLVPWNEALLPSILSTIGYFIPLYVIGYFALQLRELESK